MYNALLPEKFSVTGKDGFIDTGKAIGSDRKEVMDSSDVSQMYACAIVVVGKSSVDATLACFILLLLLRHIAKIQPAIMLSGQTMKNMYDAPIPVKVQRP